MSSLEAKKIAPATGTTVTLGAAGDTVDVSANALKTNTIKDAGGNTIFTSDGSGTLSNVNSALKGGLIFISSQTASDSASVEFTTGIDSTYNEYVFIFTRINPATDQANFTFQCSTDGGSNYDVALTSTYFNAYHYEADTGANLGYYSGFDQQNGTSYQPLNDHQGNDADQCCAGMLHLFNPSSVTYVKHFYTTNNESGYDEYSQENFMAGFFNTSSAITAISFKMSSGNLDGTIAMYGTG